MSTDPPNPHTQDSSPPPRRRRRWLSTIALLASVTLPLLGVSWAVCYGGSTWQDLLTRFRPASSGSSDHDSSFGRRASGEPGIAYRGNGRVQLGQFSVSSYNPITRLTLKADFQLEGVTSCPDREAFDRFMQSSHRFFREQVMVSVRNSARAELIDPGLRLLKRRIVARVNLAMGRPFLKSVAIKDFNLLELSHESAPVAAQDGAPLTP